MKIELILPDSTTRFSLDIEFSPCSLPGPVTHVEISIMAKTLTATYKLPTVTGDSPLDHVDIALSYDGGVTYQAPTPNPVTADAVQTYTATVEDNLTHVQFTVFNVNGKAGAPLAAPVTAGADVPGVVTDVTLTLV